MKKNIIYNVIYQVLMLIVPIITIPYISRKLGAEGIGTYSYTYSIAYYFMLIAMLGLNNYGNRTIAKARDNKEKLSKEFCSIYAMQIIVSTIMVIAYVAYVLLFNNSYKIIALIQSLYVISSVFDINWFYFGMEKFKLTITRNAIIKLLSLILIIVFVKTPNDVWKYTVILAGSTLLNNGILFLFLPKYVKFSKVTKKDVAKHFKPTIVLFLPVIAVSIYKIMDKIMLGIMSTVTEVGYYENAEKITQASLTIITALGTVMLPRASNMISNKQDEKLKEILEKTLSFLMLLSFPISLGLVAVGRDFALIFFGSEFEKSGYLIQLLATTHIFLSWGNVIRTQYLIPKERDKEYIISAFLGAIVNFILNLIFIPKYASIGACIGTIAAEFVVVFYQTWTVRKELPILKYLKNVMAFAIKSLVMFIIIVFIGGKIKNDALTRMMIQIILGMLLYFILNYKYILNELGIKKYIEKIKGKLKCKHI